MANMLTSRILVAAYWLFIVLMLATFTANLAAFLTVERMATTVQVRSPFYKIFTAARRC